MLLNHQMKSTIRNILLGAATIGNIFPSASPPVIKPLYKPYASDADAIRSDWEAVGNDLKSVMKRVGHVK
jgi:hypothetical protein